MAPKLPYPGRHKDDEGNLPQRYRHMPLYIFAAIQAKHTKQEHAYRDLPRQQEIVNNHYKRCEYGQVITPVVQIKMEQPYTI